MSMSMKVNIMDTDENEIPHWQNIRWSEILELKKNILDIRTNLFLNFVILLCNANGRNKNPQTMSCNDIPVIMMNAPI